MILLTTALLALAAGAALFVPVLVEKYKERQAKLKPVTVRRRQ